jgi:hypothetical protein
MDCAAVPWSQGRDNRDPVERTRRLSLPSVRSALVERGDPARWFAQLLPPRCGLIGARSYFGTRRGPTASLQRKQFGEVGVQRDSQRAGGQDIQAAGLAASLTEIESSVHSPRSPDRPVSTDRPRFYGENKDAAAQRANQPLVPPVAGTAGLVPPHSSESVTPRSLRGPARRRRNPGLRRRTAARLGAADARGGTRACPPTAPDVPGRA